MFKEKKYVVIKKALSFELANFIFNYLLLKQGVVKWMHEQGFLSKKTPGYGSWEDKQVPNTYSCHSDMCMDTLLLKLLPIMRKHTGMNLVPCYTYLRIYKKGDILKRHKDKPSCEISATLHLGGTPWTIFIEGTPVNLKVGDMLAYKGCDLEHWREPLEGKHCVQGFLHYNDINGPFGTKNKFDQRPLLGIPLQKRKIRR
jgi:hypothetical protein